MYHFCVYTFFCLKHNSLACWTCFVERCRWLDLIWNMWAVCMNNDFKSSTKSFQQRKTKTSAHKWKQKTPNEKLKMMRRSPLNFQLKKKRASTFYMAFCAIHSFHLKYVYFSSDKIVLISRFSAFTFHSLYFPSHAHFTTFPNFAAHFCSVRLSQPLSCIIDINRVRALAIILPSSEMLRDFFFSFQTNYL